MDFWDAFLVVRRRWCVAASAFLVAVGWVGMMAVSVPEEYRSSATLVLTSPPTVPLATERGSGIAVRTNPLMNFDSGLSNSVSFLIQQLPAVSSQFPVLANSNGQTGFGLRQVGPTIKGDPQSPLLIIEGSSNSAADCLEIVTAVTDRAKTIMSERQTQLRVPPDQRISVVDVVRPTPPQRIGGGHVRAALVALVFGSTAAVVAAAAAEGWSHRRQRRNRGLKASHGRWIFSGPALLKGWTRRIQDFAADEDRTADGSARTRALLSTGDFPSTGAFLSHGGGSRHADPSRGGSLDGATLVAAFTVALTTISAMLVVRALPISVSVATIIALALGLTWAFSHMVWSLGMAKGFNVVRGVLLLYLFTQLATYASATLGFLSPQELHSTDHTLVTVGGSIAIALFVCDAVRNMDRLTLVMKVVVLGATFMASIGIIQATTGFDLTKYMVWPGLRLTADFPRVISRADLHRPFGTAGHPIEYGVVCAMAFQIALFLALRPGPAASRRWLWWTCTALLGGGAVLSLSRSAVLGMGAALVVLAIGWPMRRRLILVGGVALGLAVANFFIPAVTATILNLFADAENDPSVLARLRDYDAAMTEIARHPWLGKGLGTWLPTYYIILDNQYLKTWLENGIVGLVAFILIFLGAAYAALRCLRSRIPEARQLALSLLAALIVPAVGAATYDSLSFDVSTGLTFLLIGSAGALLRISTAASRPAADPNSRSPGARTPVSVRT